MWLALLIACVLAVTPSAFAAECTGCPYAYSSLGTVSFNASSYEQYGQAPPGSYIGSDIWIMTPGSDGNIYGVWGDGQGWNLSIAYGSLGVTRITDDPPTMAATDALSDWHRDWKPRAVVADTANTMTGWFGVPEDGWDGTYTFSLSSINGTPSVSDPDNAIFSVATDGFTVLAAAQSAAGYTSLPAELSTDNYYLLLGLQGVQGGGSQDFYLARVPKASWDTKASYEVFTGLDGSQNPQWSSTLASRASIFHDANGVETYVSVVWWPQLGTTGRWILAKPFNTNQLGIFESEHLWGPWTTLYYGAFRDSYWKFSYQTPQKWMSTSAPWTFWMGFSGHPEYDNVNFVQGTITAQDTVAPAAPTNLQATPVSTSRIDLQWTAPTQNADASTLIDLAGYRILYCSGASCTPTTAISPDPGLVTSYQHSSGLSANTTYRYLIRAKDTTGNLSSDSEIVESYTAAEETLAVSATSTPNDWTTGPTTGQDKVAYVTTNGNDGNTTYITTGTNGVQQQYALANPADIASSDNITNVRLRAYAEKIVSQGVSLVLTAVLGANTSAATCALTNGVYTECLLDMATKPGGGAWTVTDVQNLEVRVQPNASRVTRVTWLQAVVTYVPDPPPRPGSSLSANPSDATTIDLSWSLPTTNVDNSALTDLTAQRLIWCSGGSCVPDGTNTVARSASDTTYQHTGRTTGVTYGYRVEAQDGTGQWSAPGNLTYATPSASPPSLIQEHWRFHTSGLASAVAQATLDQATRLRADGSVRLRISLWNDGTSNSRTYPLECNVDAAGWNTLTTSCVATGVCLRATGGYSDGASVSPVLPLPVGASGVASARFSSTAGWPTVNLANAEAAEMEYDLGISGLTAGAQVCCRVATLDSYSDPPGTPCMTVVGGALQR